MCRACTLAIARYEFTLDFIVLEKVGFNTIMGMDWLTTFMAHIDYYRRRVAFRALDG